MASKQSGWATAGVKSQSCDRNTHSIIHATAMKLLSEADLRHLWLMNDLWSLIHGCSAAFDDRSPTERGLIFYFCFSSNGNPCFTRRSFGGSLLKGCTAVSFDGPVWAGGPVAAGSSQALSHSAAHPGSASHMPSFRLCVPACVLDHSKVLLWGHLWLFRAHFPPTQDPSRQKSAMTLLFI